MAVLDLCYYGNPILEKRIPEIKDINDEVKEFCSNLIDSMKFYEGLGLSANQVGKEFRVFAIDLKIIDDKLEAQVFINPEIIEEHGEQYDMEGCLSFPEVFEKVKRPERVKLKYIDIDGNKREMEAEGLLARAFCHELDHLNGVYFVERMSNLKQKLLGRKLRRIKERFND